MKSILLITMLALSANVFSSVSSTVNLRSNYILYGFSASNNASIIDGSMSYSHDSGVSIGLWAGSYGGTNEADIVLGYEKSLGDITLSAAYTRWVFLTDSDSDANTYSLGFDWKSLSLTVELIDNWAHSFSTKSSALYGVLSYERELSSLESTLVAEIGYNDMDKKNLVGYDSYTHWGLGLRKDFKEFSGSLMFTDTNRESLTNVEFKDQTFTFMASTTF